MSTWTGLICRHKQIFRILYYSRSDIIADVLNTIWKSAQYSIEKASTEPDFSRADVVILWQQMLSKASGSAKISYRFCGLGQAHKKFGGWPHRQQNLAKGQSLAALSTEEGKWFDITMPPKKDTTTRICVWCIEPSFKPFRNYRDSQWGMRRALSTQRLGWDRGLWAASWSAWRDQTASNHWHLGGQAWAAWCEVNNSTFWPMWFAYSGLIRLVCTLRLNQARLVCIFLCPHDIAAMISSPRLLLKPFDPVIWEQIRAALHWKVNCDCEGGLRDRRVEGPSLLLPLWLMNTGAPSPRSGPSRKTSCLHPICTIRQQYKCHGQTTTILLLGLARCKSRLRWSNALGNCDDILRPGVYICNANRRCHWRSKRGSRAGRHGWWR